MLSFFLLLTTKKSCLLLKKLSHLSAFRRQTICVHLVLILKNKKPSESIFNILEKTCFEGDLVSPSQGGTLHHLDCSQCSLNKT